MLDFKKKPIIAVIYLRPLLGYKEHPGMNKVIDCALEDLEVLERCGVDGALLENEHDRPYTVSAGREVISSMSIVSHHVKSNAKNCIIGSEFLINDPKASLAIAKASNLSFIRTDYFVDRMAREEYGGEMEIDPKGLLAYREKIEANDVQLLTDIQVKYATMLEDKSLSQSAREAYENKSSAAIVSGRVTGSPPNKEEIIEAKSGAPDLPIIIGSGLDHKNAPELFPHLDGAILASAILTDTRMDYEKVAPFMDIIRRLR